MAGVAKFCSPLHTSVRGFRTTARRLKDATPAEVKGTPYNKLNIGVPAETWTNEKRVACTPAVTAMLTKKGFTVNVQEGAGKLSSFRDDDFAAAGAKIVSKEAAFQQDITLKLRQPSMEETKLFRLPPNFQVSKQSYYCLFSGTRPFYILSSIPDKTQILSRPWQRRSSLPSAWTASPESPELRSLTLCPPWPTSAVTEQSSRLPITLEGQFSNN